MQNKNPRSKIIDEFTNLNISRQRKYQLRKAKIKCCAICGKPIEHFAWFCDEHYWYSREYHRKRLGCKKRSLNCKSYKILGI